VVNKVSGLSKKFDDDQLRNAARLWLDASILATGSFQNNIQAVYLGALLFVSDRPMSISELARHEFVGSRRSALRWANQLIERGVAERTSEGLVITDKGNETARYFFGVLANIAREI
jgi:hypothetical protein